MILRAASQKLLPVMLAMAWLIAGRQGASSLASSASAAKPSCNCCKADRSNCATHACCAQPVEDREPVTPAAPRYAASQELHAVSPPVVALLTLPRYTLDAATALP